MEISFDRIVYLLREVGSKKRRNAVAVELRARNEALEYVRGLSEGDLEVLRRDLVSMGLLPFSVQDLDGLCQDFGPELVDCPPRLQA